MHPRFSARSEGLPPGGIHEVANQKAFDRKGRKVAKKNENELLVRQTGPESKAFNRRDRRDYAEVAEKTNRYS